MERRLDFEADYIFRYSGDHSNYIDACPEWLRKALQEQYSPFDTFLAGIEPERKIRVKISLEILGDE